MAEAQDYISQIIENAIQTANEMTEKVDDAAHDLINANSGIYIAPPATATGFVVSAIEPEVPTVADSKLNYSAELDHIIALLSGQLADFFAKYYPLTSDAFDEATGWIRNTIQNGIGSGVGLQAQQWQRAREDIIIDGRRVENQILTGFAAKGIRMAPGAMFKQVDASRRDQTAKTGIAATTIAGKLYEIEVETVKFAVTEAMKSRQMAMQAAADYIRAIASAPEAAVRVADLNGDAQARMMSAAADFYRARMTKDELILKARMAEVGLDFDVYKHRRDNATQNSEVKVRSLTAGADAYARTAQASLSSLNTVAATATNAFS